MDDTSPEIKDRFMKMMMEKSGQERLKMGFSMFDFAKRQIIASIKDKDPSIDEIDLKREVFLRFYGHEFSQNELNLILKHLFLTKEPPGHSIS